MLERVSWMEWDKKNDSLNLGGTRLTKGVAQTALLTGLSKGLRDQP
jgi:hypothetical protein